MTKIVQYMHTMLIRHDERHKTVQPGAVGEKIGWRFLACTGRNPVYLCDISLPTNIPEWTSHIPCFEQVTSSIVIHGMAKIAELELLVLPTSWAILSLLNMPFSFIEAANQYPGNLVFVEKVYTQLNSPW